MTNSEIIFNEVCNRYTPAQRHDLVSQFLPAEKVQEYAAGLKFQPDKNGNTPDPMEAAEAFLCSSLFHTFQEWKRNGLSVKKGESAAFSCELWKHTDKDMKQPAPDADELTKAAFEQDNGHYYLAKAHLFHRGQVEKSKPQPAGRFKSADEIRAYNKMLADQRKAAKAAAAQQDKPETPAAPKSEQPAAVITEERHELPKLAKAPKLPAKKASNPSTDALKKAANKAKREFMAVSEEDRPAQAAALAKWRDARKAVKDAEQTAPAAPAPKSEPKPQSKHKATPAPSAAPVYCEQVSMF